MNTNPATDAGSVTSASDRFKNILRGLYYGIGILVLLVFTVLLTFVVLLRWLPPPTTAFMLEYRFSHNRKPVYHWVSANKISPYLALAVIASEDQKFPYHHGFDFESIDDVLSRDNPKRIRGASTISQQVAKNLFLWPGKTYFRKGIEAGITFLLELIWSKKRIIEVYLNIAEFGDGVFGAGAACHTYFKAQPSTLTRVEAAQMAAVLPAPDRLHINHPSAYVQIRTGWIFYQMQRLGGTSYLNTIGYPK